MRICLDARQLREVKTGLGRYAENLVREIASLDQENEYVVLRRSSYPNSLALADNFTEVRVGYGISSTRNLLVGSRVINPLDVDIYHALYHFLPLGVRARKIVVTLHDLIWVEHAALATDIRVKEWLKRLRGGPLIGRALRLADFVITVSEATRQAARSRFCLAEAKSTVIHHGVDPVFLASATGRLPEACRGKRFVFSLGTSTPYKNVGRLIRAFGVIAAEFPDLYLLISGRGDSYPSLLKLAREVAPEGRIAFTGQLNDAGVRMCFDHAEFLAFPSIVEGFGLPVIEAMASGCPVLTSNTSSLVEISGEAALCVDPLDLDALASGMRRLLTDESLRRRLAESGKERSRLFNWRTCAEKTLDVYRNIRFQSES